MVRQARDPAPGRKADIYRTFAGRPAAQAGRPNRPPAARAGRPSRSRRQARGLAVGSRWEAHGWGRGGPMTCLWVPITHKTAPTCGLPQVRGGLKWWRWRESNPRPSTPSQGFSGRSLLCFSRPRRSRRRVADGLSHCLISRSPPWPGRSVEPSSDARHRAEGTPGLTVVSLLRQRAPGQTWQPQCSWNWHLLFAVTGLTRLCPQSSARFTWLAKSKSKPVTPCAVVNTSPGGAAQHECTWHNTLNANLIPRGGTPGRHGETAARHGETAAQHDERPPLRLEGPAHGERPSGHGETPGSAAQQLALPGADRQGRAGPDGRTSPEMKS